MKRLTMMLLSFGIGLNLRGEWLMSLSLGRMLVLVLSVGIIVTGVTEWAYYPRNK
jgi:hypothetical protein